MIRVGIVGLGYWGPNLVRCLHSARDCHVIAICDRDPKRLQKVSQKYPGLRTTSDDREVLETGLVDAVVIATPTKTHFELARRALKNGLHVFVEKPLATSSAECRELIELADRRQLTLFVGHVFLYSAPVAKLRELVSGGFLGDVCYVSSKRLNLGPVRQDVNALWDLAPHDVSIMLDLMDDTPVSVSCSGLAYLNEHVHDVCTLSLHFQGKKMGIIHVSWLDPHKRREMTVVGNGKMAVYDDIEPLEKIKIYDIGIEKPNYADSFGEFAFSYRYGDTFSPRLDEVEPLKAECQSFISAVKSRQRPRTDGWNGLNVVQVIEAADRSLHNGGGHVEIEHPRRLSAALLPT